MSYFRKYQVIIIFSLLEIIFYFRLEIADHQTYFFTWGIIGFAFFIFNIFNVIKANPILSLFNANVRKNSIDQLPSSKMSFQEKIFNEKSLIFIFFIVMNFLLYLFV